MTNKVSHIKEALSGPAQMLKVLEARKAAYETRIEEIGARKTQYLRAQIVLDQAISRVSEGGIQKIEEMVTTGLNLTFPDMDLKFVIEKKTGARGNSYRFLVKEGEVAGPVSDTFGGGVVNVTQFLLRVIMIQRFGLARFMALDETFANVSEDYLPRVSELLRSLCDDEQFKILLVTHQPRLAAAADSVYRVSPGPGILKLDSQELDDLRSLDEV
jgi:DNA repair exonuclease SbcCD ATPase subunit